MKNSEKNIQAKNRVRFSVVILFMIALLSAYGAFRLYVHIKLERERIRAEQASMMLRATKNKGIFRLKRPQAFREKWRYEDRKEDEHYYTPTNGAISSRFGWRSFFGRMHYGLDIAAPKGTRVYAADQGVITRAEWRGNYGLFIEIDHNNGVVSRYAHLDAVMVRPGEYVFRGEYIGQVGNTGRSTGPHLHFELLFEGERVDPEPYLF